MEMEGRPEMANAIGEEEQNALRGYYDQLKEIHGEKVPGFENLMAIAEPWDGEGSMTDWLYEQADKFEKSIGIQDDEEELDQAAQPSRELGVGSRTFGVGREKQ